MMFMFPLVLHLLLPVELSPPPVPDYEAAAEYSRRLGGRALLVMVGEEIAFERWHNGARDGHMQTIFSGTKSFACALALLAVADGKITLDDRVADALPELAARETSAAITVRSLLWQTSGMKGGGTPVRGDHHAWIRKHGRLLAGRRPGSTFAYGAAHFDLFSAYLKERLGEDPIDYLERRLLRPLDMRWRDWRTDGVGQRFLAFGMVTTPRAWARFGALMRDDGVFETRRLLPAGAAVECFQGSATNPAYGLGWWLNAPMDPRIRRAPGFPATLRGLVADGRRRAILPDGPADLAMAAGSLDSRLYVVPSRRMVIVRFGGRDDPRFEDGRLLAPLLPRWRVGWGDLD